MLTSGEISLILESVDARYLSGRITRLDYRSIVNKVKCLSVSDDTEQAEPDTFFEENES
jgi:hypothetical protein